MKRLTQSQLETGMQVMFETCKSPNTQEQQWVVDLIGYVTGDSITLMSHGEFPKHYPFFEYNKEAQTYLLLHNDNVLESSATTLTQNLKELT